MQGKRSRHAKQDGAEGAHSQDHGLHRIHPFDNPEATNVAAGDAHCGYNVARPGGPIPMPGPAPTRTTPRPLK